MKSVGIITLCGNSNFGNKLQNYAIIYSLKKMNIKVETIWIENEYKSNFIKQELKKYKRFFNDYFINGKRNKKFIKFNQYLNINKKIVYNNDMKKKCNKYDYLLVGSDQVWNPSLFDNNSIFLLEDINVKKSSISASFGIEQIPKERIKDYQKNLEDFDYISVREDTGKRIVEDLTGRKDVEVLIDPTMLLTDKEWDEISIKPKQLDEQGIKKYILNYFLGNLSEARKKEINRIAKENNCSIINILDKDDPFYRSGPCEFLYLEKNAFLICTDSFHSCVFSILYNKPFIVFEREGSKNSMSTRIDTLINKFKLKNRKFNNSITKDNLNHDYTDAYAILQKEREKANKFIKKSLEIVDEN